MERPQVRLIQDQQVEVTREIIGSEAEELLRKYGHGPDSQYSTRVEHQPIKQELTFDEMVTQQENQEREEKARRDHQMTGPKPITFNGQSGYDSEVKYGSDESGFGFRIEITSDMKLPR